MKKCVFVFELESLSSSHYGEKVFKLFALSVLWFFVASAVFYLQWSVLLLFLLLVEQSRYSLYI